MVKIPVGPREECTDGYVSDRSQMLMEASGAGVAILVTVDSRYNFEKKRRLVSAKKKET
jgi:hypothetical protein